MIIVVIHIFYRKFSYKIERAVDFPEIHHWIYPLIIICILGYIYICFLTISYIFNPNFAFNLFLPIKILNLDLIKYIGDIFVIIGTILFLIAYFNLNSLTDLANKSDSSELKTTGIYAISRNPIYLGLHIITFGFSLIIPTWITFICIIIFIINFHYRIKLEEKELEEIFGKAYIAYKRKVLRYIGRRIRS
ncbi:MAG: methyltransferase family protein [Promethearchaeota archaeon]